jgi:hypothetical protein
MMELQAGNWWLDAISYSQNGREVGEQARSKKRDLTRGLFRVRLAGSCRAFSLGLAKHIISRCWTRRLMKKHTRTQVQWKSIT